MKRKIDIIVVTSLLAFAAVGCSNSNITELVSALSHDGATVKINLITPWGQENFERSMPAGMVNTNPVVATPGVSAVSPNGVSK